MNMKCVCVIFVGYVCLVSCVVTLSNLAEVPGVARGSFKNRLKINKFRFLKKKN